MTHLRKLLDEAGPSEPRRYAPPDRTSGADVTLMVAAGFVALAIGFTTIALWVLTVVMITLAVGWLVIPFQRRRPRWWR